MRAENRRVTISRSPEPIFAASGLFDSVALRRLRELRPSPQREYERQPHLMQQCRSHIIELSVSYQSGNSPLTEGKIPDWISQSNLTIDPIFRISPVL
jgi:hypothetical protein